MSGNGYTKVTVSPWLPAALVTPLHRAVLAACGFEFDEAEERQLVFVYSDCNFGFFDREAFDERVADEDLLNEDDDSRLANAVRELLPEMSDDDGILRNAAFFDIVQRAKGIRGMDEIVLKGAYYSDRMVPDEFGGFVVRYSRAGIQGSSTEELLEEMRLEVRRVNQIAELVDLAEAAINNRGGDAPVDEIKRNAVDEIRDWVVNHPMRDANSRPDLPPRTFAKVEWTADDVLERRPGWSRAAADEWLANNAAALRQAMIDAGLDLIAS